MDFKALRELLSPCHLCPRECSVNRLAGEPGWCGVGPHASIAAATAHFGEEPEISGTAGSGTIFFRGCNLKCLYCQNFEISQRPIEEYDSIEMLSETMLDLQARGCHNINLVTPSHVVPFAIEAFAMARGRGLELPLVYNTSGYDGIETLRLLRGIVSVYLTDLRYSDPDVAAELSGASNYVEASRAAVMEMASQVGIENVISQDGTITRGLIIRILVLPNDLAGVRETLAFIKSELGTKVRISLMSQYFPTNLAHSHPLLSRRLYFGEYARAIETAERMGFDNILCQDVSAPDFYCPDFMRGPEPFRDAALYQKAIKR